MCRRALSPPPPLDCHPVGSCPPCRHWRPLRADPDRGADHSPGANAPLAGQRIAVQRRRAARGGLVQGLCRGAVPEATRARTTAQVLASPAPSGCRCACWSTSIPKSSSRPSTRASRAMRQRPGNRPWAHAWRASTTLLRAVGKVEAARRDRPRLGCPASGHAARAATVQLRGEPIPGDDFYAALLLIFIGEQAGRCRTRRSACSAGRWVVRRLRAAHGMRYSHSGRRADDHET